MTPKSGAARAILGLEGGGTAEVTASDGTVVELLASRAFPPGSTLTMRRGDDPRPLRIKVRGSKRLADEGERPFRVEGRFVDLTREQRDTLLSAIRADEDP